MKDVLRVRATTQMSKGITVSPVDLDKEEKGISNCSTSFAMAVTELEWKVTAIILSFHTFPAKLQMA